jgi:HEAT repeat protein
MRQLLFCVGTCLALILLVPAAARPQDETDKVVFNKRASEWMTILRDDKSTVRDKRRALIALTTAGPQTRKVFENIGTALREDREIVIRKQAARTLGVLAAKGQDPERAEKVNVKPAVEALIFALKRDKEAEVREASATALGRIGPVGLPPDRFTPAAKEAVPDLAAALKDASPDVRAAAADALGSLGAHARDVVPELAQALRDNKGKDGLRLRAYLVSALGRIGRPARASVSALVEVMNEPDLAGASLEQRRSQAELRRNAVEALGAIESPAALEPLARLLEKSMAARDGVMSRAAIVAINQFGLERRAILPVLVKALTAEQDTDVRCNAMHAVGQLGRDLGGNRRTVISELRKGLKDKISDVRLAAILALGELGPDVLGDDLKAVKEELRLATRTGQKAIDEAAAATLKLLDRER